MAGYNAKNSAQAAHNLEKGNIANIIDAIVTHRKLDDFAGGKGELKKQIDALTTSAQAKKALKVIEDATGEEAIRLQFYNNIANGKTKQIERTIVKDKDGNIKEERIVEKEPTISDRMMARGKLDALMGLNQMPSTVGALQAGQITVTIVDASNKSQLQDKRNDVVIDADFNTLPADAELTDPNGVSDNE